MSQTIMLDTSSNTKTRMTFRVNGTAVFATALGGRGHASQTVSLSAGDQIIVQLEKTAVDPDFGYVTEIYKA